MAKKKKETMILLCSYFEELIRRKREAGKHSTADLYRATNNWIKKFIRGQELLPDEVTPHLIDRFKLFLQTQESLKSNSIISYICNFRAMYNAALRENVISSQQHPFAHLSLHREKSAKRAIPLQEIERICRAEWKQSDMRFSADLFVFSFLASGIPFADLARLRDSNIVGGEIVYKRKKTGTLIRIRITDGMQQLLDKYKGMNGAYLFPILKRGDKTTHEDYKAALHHYNTHLKEIGRQLGIQKELTSYVIRHSWATEALKQHTPVAIISQALGHTSETTTRYYLSQLDQSELDRANALITGSISKILKKKD